MGPKWLWDKEEKPGLSHLSYQFDVSQPESRRVVENYHLQAVEA